MTEIATTATTTRKGSIALVVSLIGVGLVILGSVAFYLISQVNKLSNFCVEFLKSSTKINKLGINNTDITLYFKLLNKSDIEATVDGYQLEIYVNGIKVSTAYQNKQMRINANGYSILEVRAVFNPLQVLQLGVVNVADFMSHHENIKIRIEGKLIGIKSVIKISEIPLTYNTNLKELTSNDTTTDTSDCK